jgi:ABC-type antimicrobial peptide transport system permease subunit
LLVATDHLKASFPEVSGFRLFLIQSNQPTAADRERIAMLLERTFGDQGMDLQDATAALRELLAIQNTYLSTFQSLGAMGLILGTIGLAIVEVRNLLERRQELALLTAVGFSSRRVRALVTMEHFGLLVLGVLVGSGAALITVLPHMLTAKTPPPVTDLLVVLLSIGLVGWLASYGASWVVAQSVLLRSLRND